MTEQPNLYAELKHTTDVKVGDRLVGGIVRGIRYSASRKSVWFTLEGSRGTKEWPRESTITRTAVFHEPAPAEVREQDARDHPHDDPCPRCGRRQWLDENAQETCQACGFTTYTVVGVRAKFWAEQTGSARETVIFDGRQQIPAEDAAHFLSTSNMDDGAVDFWPEVGGWVEVRADGGALVAAFVNGRRFTPEQFAARQEHNAYAD